ncbi:MAG: hypothetical protein HY063_14680 [Bacteroidetes bacterium]|nr:hypothetical protein [Bacteroidota bacterium]
MRTSFILPMMFISTLIFAETNFISVEEAVKKKLVKVHIYGKGGHCGEVIRMKILNM